MGGLPGAHWRSTTPTPPTILMCPDVPTLPFVPPLPHAPTTSHPTHHYHHHWSGGYDLPGYTSGLQRYSVVQGAGRWAGA